MISTAMIDAAITAPEAIARFAREPVRPSLVWRMSIFIMVVILIVPVGLVALGSGTGLVALPYEMFELAGRAPILFPLHMVSSALALLFAPLVIILRHRPHLHKPLGRALGGFVVIGGLTALPVAVLSHSAPWARAGFFVQGLVWLTLLGLAMAAIRRRNIRQHAQFMVAMVAVTTGAVWFRVLTGLAIVLHLPFEPVYAAAAWIGWIVPLAIVTARPQIADSLLVPRRRLVPSSA